MTLSRGYTMVEMMVVAAVLGLVMAYMMQTVTYQQRAYMVTEQVTQAQQNLRLIADLIEREIRVAGYMVPPAAAACAMDSTTGPDTLYVSAADKIRSVEDLESVDVTMVRGNMGALVSGLSTGTLASGDVSFTFDKTFVDVQADGVDFEEGAGIILVDRNDPQGVVACGVIKTWPTGCTSAANNCPNVVITFETNNFNVDNSTGDIVAVPAHVYRIDQTAGLPNRLFRDNDMMAADVEDLQVVFFYDDDNDRVVDTTLPAPLELYGDAGTPTLPAASTIDHNKLIEIRLNMVTTTRTDDPNDDFPQMQRQVTGNRTAPVAGVGTDRKRRRVHQTTVRLRNLG